MAILKFVALGIGIASGLVGTLAETKDKSAGKLTNGGKLILGLIVASGVVAGGKQAIDVLEENCGSSGPGSTSAGI